MSELRYPLSKDEYGRAMWSIIHSYTAGLPDKVDRTQKIKLRQTLADLVEHLPCSDCQDHARAYLKDNKPVYSTNKEAFQYFCDFHNHINESTGKPVQNCADLWEKRSQPCTNCSTMAKIDQESTQEKSQTEGENRKGIQSASPQQPSQENSNPETNNTAEHDSTDQHPKEALTVDQSATPHPFNIAEHPTGSSTRDEDNNDGKKRITVDQFLSQSLKTSLEDYKNVSTRMFETMCRNAGAPMPELIFSEKTECSNPESSCTHFPINKATGRLEDGAPSRVYLNINQYSPRSVIHEALHYISKVKGLDILSPTHEAEITKGARDIMARDFPVSNARAASGNDRVKELKDEGVTPASLDPYKNFKERSRRRLDGFTSNLPYYSRYYHGAKKHKKEEPSPRVVPTASYAGGQPSYPPVPIQQAPPEPPPTPSASEGFISMLDPVFAPFADALGMPARDVNIAHTPALLANGGIVLVESNVNKFGSMVISLVSSLATLAAGTLAKESIGLTDKKLLVGLGGALFWNGALRYITNPKISEEIIEHATAFGNSIAAGDVNAMVATLTTEKPKEVEKDPLGRGGRIPERGGGLNFRQQLGSPVGGQGVPVNRNAGRSSEYNLDDVTGDIYTDPDSVIQSDARASQGSFKRPSWFPSMG